VSGLSGRLLPEELTALIEGGEVDTFLTVFPDLQGRLVGKRVVSDFYLEHVARGDGIDACNYLIAVDVDMTPLPGYRFANWEQGYGDMRAVPDADTIRFVPWLERTAMVVCDLVNVESGAPVEVSPRQILRRQIERAAALGMSVKCGPEFEFFLFRESFEEAAAQGYQHLTPHSDFIEDYHMLQTTKDEYLIGKIRRGMNGAGIPVEFSKGEAGYGQHEINLRYANALEMADRASIYKNGAKEIAALSGRAITFMAKYSMEDVGSSCHIHSSVWDAATDQSLCWDEDRHGPSDTLRWWIGGLLATGAELAWCFAPYVNSYKRYQPESWAPTALAWGRDNRTVAYRLVGEGASMRVESRVPGADVNPYIAIAATIAAGLHGIEHRLEPPPPFTGNGYTASDVPRVPSTLVEAIDAFEESETARKAFGEDVHAHLLNTARQEWASSNKVVTDWELRRNFERI
jgi:glutamine synthetase